MTQYTLKDKIEALAALEKTPDDIAAVSKTTGVSVEKLRQWRRDATQIRQAQRHEQREKAALVMSAVEMHMAETSLKLVKAMDNADRIDKAPLNQVAAALGVLVDRYLKLAGETTEHSEQVIRFEYVYPNGEIADTPPWSGAHPELDSTLPGGGVRQAVRQDRTGKTYSNGKSAAVRDADLVARAHLSDGESGLAGFESDDAERLWYDD